MNSSPNWQLKLELIFPRLIDAALAYERKGGQYIWVARTVGRALRCAHGEGLLFFLSSHLKFTQNENWKIQLVASESSRTLTNECFNKTAWCDGTILKRTATKQPQISRSSILCDWPDSYYTWGVSYEAVVVGGKRFYNHSETLSLHQMPRN